MFRTDRSQRYVLRVFLGVLRLYRIHIRMVSTLSCINRALELLSYIWAFACFHSADSFQSVWSRLQRSVNIVFI